MSCCPALPVTSRVLALGQNWVRQAGSNTQSPPRRRIEEEIQGPTLSPSSHMQQKNPRARPVSEWGRRERSLASWRELGSTPVLCSVLCLIRLNVCKGAWTKGSLLWLAVIVRWTDNTTTRRLALLAVSQPELALLLRLGIARAIVYGVHTVCDETEKVCGEQIMEQRLYTTHCSNRDAETWKDQGGARRSNRLNVLVAKAVRTCNFDSVPPGSTKHPRSR